MVAEVFGMRERKSQPSSNLHFSLDTRLDPIDPPNNILPKLTPAINDSYNFKLETLVFTIVGILTRTFALHRGDKPIWDEVYLSSFWYSYARHID